MALLARREHSRVELAQKLERAGGNPENFPALFEYLEANNWLSDRRFAESYVADHRARDGAIKLAYALRQRGIADALITEVLSTLNSGHSDDSEVARAREIWRKKFKAQPSSPEERAKQMRFLQGRGFSVETIRVAMKVEDGDA